MQMGSVGRSVGWEMVGWLVGGLFGHMGMMGQVLVN